MEDERDKDSAMGYPYGDFQRQLESQAGCTATMALITPNEIYCANAGDSRAVAYLKEGTTLPLSFDHKPDNADEKMRIESAGGFVSENRVNGNLNLSRAFGDFS